MVTGWQNCSVLTSMNFLLTICSISFSWLQERKEMLVAEKEEMLEEEKEAGKPCKGEEVAEWMAEPEIVYLYYSGGDAGRVWHKVVFVFVFVKKSLNLAAAELMWSGCEGREILNIWKLLIA